MKRILGLDIGTASIGWALVDYDANDQASSIVKVGSRIIQYDTFNKVDKNGKVTESKNPKEDFTSGKGLSPNADRTLKRGMRRSLQRYKQRRAHLLQLLANHKIISSDTILTETGSNSTHTLWAIRAKAAEEEIALEDFARVLLAINKKRGYKSNRKAKEEGDGQAIDGMEVAKQLYEEGITTGEFVYQRLLQDKRIVPDFYKSDLRSEFDKVWEQQKKYHEETLTDELKDKLQDKNKGQTWKICEEPFGISGVKLPQKGIELKVELYRLRTIALQEQLPLEHLAIVLQEINNQIYQSSGYLGKISDRSKELYFKKQTVGQYLYTQLQVNLHTKLKNQVFYRQDYLDEFEQIWEVQAQNRKNILTNELKEQLRDTVIFYQRRLKSQKGLVSICELEGREQEIEKNGKKKKIIAGPRVVPKSSPIFQEFKIWQTLNNLKFTNTKTLETYPISELDLELEIRNAMFDLLTLKGKMKASEVLKLTVDKPKEWELCNFEEIEGNNTMSALYKAYKAIVDLSGHEPDKKNPKQRIREVFEGLGINTGILEFDSSIEGAQLEHQPIYQLWHLLYSYEGDDSVSGQESLLRHLSEKFGLAPEYGKLLANIAFKDDYGNLSARAIRKLLPHLRAGHNYSEACALEEYRHSHYLTKEENENRPLDEKLELLPRNSLRNPVVEKILNQMINVVNEVINTYGTPKEVRIELARELKKSAIERERMTKVINDNTKEHERIRKEIARLYPFNTGVRITKKDVIKYKLYEELAYRGHKTLYTNTYIERGKLFTKEFDIEHIIPQATLFDDSFTNKTLALREVNLKKGNKTAYDFIAEECGGVESEKFKEYLDRVESYLAQDKRGRKTKYRKLLMKGNEIPDGFLERDLRNSQYIAKKAQEILAKVIRDVTPTSGGVTSKLREEWQLVDVMKDLNWDKYKQLDMTRYEQTKDGRQVKVIEDWSKRNDHRHHAMDAITIAFTRLEYVQYFNFLNARHHENHKEYHKITGIEKNIMTEEVGKNGKKKTIIKPPMPLAQFRSEAKKHLENILISFKAKNKVVTKNTNKTKTRKGEHEKVELTPRGQLHKETIYGKSKTYKSKLEKVGTKFELETIQKVTKEIYRVALLKRLTEYNNDPKKAFGGKNAPTKNPIWLDQQQTVKLPEKVKLAWLEDQYTIRKDVSPDLKVEKVIDDGARRVLENRLAEFDNNPKLAFSNLEENPIWLNEERGIKIERVTITGVNNAVPLHYKKDHFGNEILNHNGDPIPADYVSTGNNHHVAIYEDEQGELQEKVVSLFEAVSASNEKQPVINKNHNADLGWKFLFTMKQNEMFVFPDEASGFDPSEIDLKDKENNARISQRLFRVQKLATKDYFFRHHLETTVDGNTKTKGKAWIRTGLSGLKGAVKVRINHLGQIIHVGE